MRETSTRCGAATPDELFERVVDKMDNIVETTCGLCGKTFYALASELYKENVFNGDAEDVMQQIIQTAKTVKCPHCGYATSIRNVSKKTGGYYGL